MKRGYQSLVLPVILPFVNGFMFQNSFGPRLGVALRPRRSLGFTPTGEVPAGCTPTGTRMIQEQGGYTPLSCPTGPDCYDLIDAVTGAVVIKGIKWSNFSEGTAPRWSPPCGQHGYTYGQSDAPAAVEQTIPGCANLSSDEWNTLVQEKEAAWQASGKSTLDGVCAVITTQEGTQEFRQQCWYPNGTTGGQAGAIETVLKEGVFSCEDAWKNTVCPALQPGSQGYEKCPKGEGMIPISIDIQAYTPAYWEAMQRGQPFPVGKPRPPATAPPPSAPEPKPLAKSAGSDLANIGIAAGVVAAGAFALSLLK